MPIEPERPAVSVVVTAYNCGRYLAEAIGSVFAQHPTPDQVIVVDDGSTDDTAAVAARFGDGILYLHQENAGIGAARNRGIEAARGRFIALLDGDDLWRVDKIALQLAAFEQDPELDLVFGYAQNFHSPELAEHQRTASAPLRPMPGLLASTMLARREAYDRVGLYQPQWTVGEFIDWYLKAQEAGLKERMLDELVLRRRIHTSNQGIRERDATSDYARIIKASLERRRKARQTQ